LRAHAAPGEVVRAQAVLGGAGLTQARAPALPYRHDVRDVASARVREAGGPIDEASYTCACGYVFLAPVSTTVACPHCGATQAW
jgi:hypothetical protein